MLLNMNMIPARKKTRLSTLVTLTLASTCTAASAGTLPGTSHTINPGDAAERWTLTNGAILTVLPGATTYGIDASGGSVVNLNGATVNGTGSNSSRGRALVVQVSGNGGAPASSTVVDSTIIGDTAGILVGGRGDPSVGGIQLSNTHVSATGNGGVGNGMLVLAGNARITNGSVVTGASNGLQIASNISLGVSANHSSVVIDGSTVEGTTGSAISVNALTAQMTPDVDILVANGSRLIGGNGNLLDVSDRSTVRFTVDRSDLAGNIVVEQGGNASVNLDNGAVLTGSLSNVQALSVSNSATWQMTADNQIGSLAMNGGNVRLSDGSGFRTLTVGSLAGQGTFFMNTDLATRAGDLLSVTGTATGDYGLHIQNTGLEPARGDAPMKIVETGGGDAQFSAVGGKVDAGAYEYTLQQRGNDWFLVQAFDDNGDPITTPSADAVLGLFNVSSTIWYGEEASLRSRMGELRLEKSTGGVWARTFGRRYLVDASSGQAYQQNQYGLSIGADKSIPVSTGRMLIGAFGGYSRNDLNFGLGTTGSVDSAFVGGYATWLADNGYYVDGVIKSNVFRNDARVRMSDGASASGGYTNFGLGGSLEFGKQIPFAQNWFVEPSLGLSVFWASGKTTLLDNGLEASGSPNQSIQGRIGASIGRNYQFANGDYVQPYVKVAVVQEFAHGNDVNINGNRFDNNLSGTRGEIGVGVAAQLSSKLQMHGDVMYSNGSKIQQPWGVNVGLRYTW